MANSNLKVVKPSLASVVASIKREYGDFRSIPDFVKEKEFKAVEVALNAALTAIPVIPIYLDDNRLNPAHPASKQYWEKFRQSM